MSSIKLSPNASGTGEFTIAAPNSNTNRTLTLPDQTGTVLTNAGPFTANASASAGAVTIDASNNVGIGTSSPSGSANYKSLTISGTSGAEIFLNAGATNYGYMYVDNGGFRIINPQSGAASGTLQFYTANTERARIDTSGNFFINSTNFPAVGVEKFGVQGGTTIAAAFITSSATQPTTFVANSTNGTVTLMRFSSGSGGSTTGNITANGTNTTYGTSSDYRLKENVQPMAGALNRVAALKPGTYTWKTDGSTGEGFIAHELAEVCPDAVQGEKDAVDAEGNPVYQGIDTSFLVATLTAAIQEQQALIESLTARIAALEGAK